MPTPTTARACTSGTCPEAALEGSSYCQAHGGRVQATPPSPPVFKPYECCEHCVEDGCPEAMTGHVIKCPDGCEQ